MRRDERRAPLNSPAWEARLWICDKEIGKKLCSINSDLPCDFKLRNLFQCNVKLSARRDSLVVFISFISRSFTKQTLQNR